MENNNIAQKALAMRCRPRSPCEQQLLLLLTRDLNYLLLLSEVELVIYLINRVILPAKN